MSCGHSPEAIDGYSMVDLEALATYINARPGVFGK